MGGAFNIGRVFGIELRLHYTWFIIFTLLTVSLAYPHWSHWFYWIVGIITSLLFFASVFAHELAHSLVAKANDIPIRSITLFIFGGVSQMTKEAARPSVELKMAAAGPACSLALSGLFYLIWRLVPLTEPISTMIQWLAYINLALALFNLVPGFPLDGGRVFRSILWRTSGNYVRATRIAAQVGRGIGYLFIVGGILIVFFRPFGLVWFSGLWLAFIGWFLENAASESYRQVRWREALQGITVAQLMTSDIPVVSPDISIDQLVHEHVLSRGRHYFMVVDEGRLQGALTLHNIKAVPQQRWGATRVKDVMTPANKLRIANLNQDALSILEQMGEVDINEMPVVSEGRVIGLVARDKVLRFLQTRSELRI